MLFDNFEDNQHLKELGNNQLTIPLAVSSLQVFLKVLCEKIQDAHAHVYVLFTSRYKISELPLTFLDLEELSFTDTYKFINRSQRLNHLKLHERRQVHNYLGGHPRVLELLNSYFRTIENPSWQEITAKFEEVETELLHYDLLIELLWESLTKEEQKVLSVAAIFRHSTPIIGLAQVLEVNLKDLELPLQRLNSMSLCYLEEGCFFVHRLSSRWILGKSSKKLYIQRHYKAAKYFSHFREKSGEKTIEVTLESRYHHLKAKVYDEYLLQTLTLYQIYCNSYKYTNALNLLKNSLAENNLPLEVIANIHTEIGMISLEKGNGNDAKTHYRKAFNIYKITKNKKSISLCCHQIGNVHFISREFEKAIIQYEKSIDISKKLNDHEETMKSYVQIGLANFQLTHFDLAINDLNKATKLNEQFKDIETQKSIYIGFADIFREVGAYKKSLEYYEKALKLLEAIKAPSQLCHALKKIGDIHEIMGNYRIAFGYLRNALEIAEKLKNEKLLVQQKLNNWQLVKSVRT